MDFTGRKILSRKRLAAGSQRTGAGEESSDLAGVFAAGGVRDVADLFLSELRRLRLHDFFGGRIETARGQSDRFSLWRALCHSVRSGRGADDSQLLALGQNPRTPRARGAGIR